MKGFFIMKTNRITFFSLAALCALVVSAREVPGLPPGPGLTGGGIKAAGCAPGTSSNELDLNNVRARIETSGTMWQSGDKPAYEVPKTENKNGPSALFAGSLWMGGLSPDNQLKIAAVRFRQIGNDFWPGPLTAYDSITQTGDASITSQECLKYDKTWKTLRKDAEAHDAYFRCLNDPLCDAAVEFPEYSMPSIYDTWPAHGDVNQQQDYNLAPYYDSPYSTQDVYDPENGDYPGYDLKASIDCKSKRREDLVPLFGDQNIWWVFNDKGAAHTESGGTPIGMEIRAQAFAFSTNDELNNMTFYNYVLINQGTQTLNNTYFAQFVDVDLGGAADDYVGCDVQRGLGYGYNGDEIDEDANGNPGYGGPVPPPPAVGVDFFEGPFQDYDGLDNPLTQDCAEARDNLGIPYKGIGIGYGDSVPDNERFGMRAFMYFNNQGGPKGDPSQAIQYYNCMQAVWGDNTPMTYGGDGYSSGSGGARSIYAFPGTSDTLGWGTDCVVQDDWSEVTEGNPPADRRFVQSAGPFTLEPGAYNNITVGVVWARASQGGVQASVSLMRTADDKAQSLFDNCFRVLNGPDAPVISFTELDKELILTISNPLGSNNFNELYSEVDPSIPELDANNDPYDRTYDFQGYQIYQVIDALVGPDELEKPEKARLLAQVDVKDDVVQLINWVQDPEMNLPVPTEKVNGANKGISHSFQIKKDLFSTGAPQLVNFKTYYYMAIAYGYNQYSPFAQSPSGSSGQPFPYLAGRKSTTGSIRSYSGIPHKPSVQNGGTVVNTQYGDGFKIVRIEGQGNGGQIIALEKSSVDDIVGSSDSQFSQITYQSGLGPVNVKVIDPLNVPAAQFELWFMDSTNIPSPTSFTSYKELKDAGWMLVRLSDAPTSSDTVRSTGTIEFPNEQLIPQWGISVNITQTAYVAYPPGLDKFAPFLGSLQENTGTPWYVGIPDAEGELAQNWIRSGAAKDTSLAYADILGKDPEQQYEKVLGGTWAPWVLCGDKNMQPCAPAMVGSRNKGNTNDIPSIQVVITPDKSKWSRCVVVEESASPEFTIPANVDKLNMRPVASVDKNGRAYGSSGANNDEAGLVNQTGMGWFPGYAVDLETGERLNVFFGENSFLGGGIGSDMLWNPSDVLQTSGFTPQPVFGGCHWIYVCYNRRRMFSETSSSTNMPLYDQGQFIRDKIASGPIGLDNVYRSVAWVGSALMAPGTSMNSPEDGLVPSEVRLRMNVSKPYFIYKTPYNGYQPAITSDRNGGLPLYSFDTGAGATETNVTEVGKSELDLIGVVPNPYYAFSGYETGRLDNRVKFINLPRSCTINIYTVSGTLVRSYRKDNELTYLDWDLKNSYNVPIAGGTYICHIDAPGLGERVIKWFGVMRPIDLQNF